jgi:hypothetical protein
MIASGLLLLFVGRILSELDNNYADKLVGVSVISGMILLGTGIFITIWRYLP